VVSTILAKVSYRKIPFPFPVIPYAHPALKDLIPDASVNSFVSLLPYPSLTGVFQSTVRNAVYNIIHTHTHIPGCYLPRALLSFSKSLWLSLSLFSFISFSCSSSPIFYHKLPPSRFLPFKGFCFTVFLINLHVELSWC